MSIWEVRPFGVLIPILGGCPPLWFASRAIARGSMEEFTPWVLWLPEWEYVV